MPYTIVLALAVFKMPIAKSLNEYFLVVLGLLTIVFNIFFLVVSNLISLHYVFVSFIGIAIMISIGLSRLLKGPSLGYYFSRQY